MRALFCGDPLDPRRPDAVYQGEAETAKAVGLEMSLIDFEALVGESDANRAVRRVAPPADVEAGVYRVQSAQYQGDAETWLDLHRFSLMDDQA